MKCNNGKVSSNISKHLFQKTNQPIEDKIFNLPILATNNKPIFYCTIFSYFECPVVQGRNKNNNSLYSKKNSSSYWTPSKKISLPVSTSPLKSFVSSKSTKNLVNWKLQRRTSPNSIVSRARAMWKLYTSFAWL